MAFNRIVKAALLALGLATAASAPALAQQGLDEPFQKPFKEALAGKTVAFVPVAMNFDLTEGWFAGLKKELEPYGVKFELRDPNWSTNAGAQAVTTLISEKPAVMVIHNPDVQTYAKLLQRAENEGIYVIQINMGSAYRSSAFVGANWIEIGEKDTEAVVKACKGKSNKIAIVQGALSAAASAYTLKGVENVLGQASGDQGRLQPGGRLGRGQGQGDHPDRAEAESRPLRHRRLLGRHGHRHRGRGQGSRTHRQGVRRDLGRRRAQGRLRPGQVRRVRPRPQLRRADAGGADGGMIKWLISSGVKPGSVKGSSYTTLIPITKENADSETACWNLSDLKK